MTTNKQMTAILVWVALGIGTGCSYVEDNRGVGGTRPVDVTLVYPSHLEHTAWDWVTHRYAGTEGFAYRLLDASPEDSAFLFASLYTVARVDPKFLATREEKLAFLINAYNASVVSGVLERLRADATFRVDRNGFSIFDEPFVVLGGQAMSLNALEHGLVRGDWNHASLQVSAVTPALKSWLQERHTDLWGDGTIDPRIHFLLNCASISCPLLQSQAVLAAGLETLLEAAAGAFLNDPLRGAGPNGISSLFDWFAADFRAAGFANPSDFIGRYRSLSGVDVSRTLTYDWALNLWVKP